MIDPVFLQPLVFFLMIALASLIILGKSADLIVFGISEYAKKIGASDHIIGILVISLGTAIPELVASLIGAVNNEGAVVFGLVMGSSLFKVPLLGFVLLLVKKMGVGHESVEHAPWLTFFITMLPFLLVIDGELSRVDGAALLFAFALYIAKLWQKEQEKGTLAKEVRINLIWEDSLIFVLSLIATLLSARWLVFSSEKIASILHISPFLIGLFVIGIGSSAPELFVQVRSALKKRDNIAMGNVIGNFPANSGFVLGLVALIQPITLNPSILTTTTIFLGLGLGSILFLLEKKKMTWVQGIFFIGIYAAFIAVELLLGKS